MILLGEIFDMLDIITITKDDIDGALRTIDSTKRLRHLGVKQIIVDSSDRDGSAKMMKILKGIKGINYFWCEPKGIASAFNFGLVKSRRQFVWFLNGGDEVYKDLDQEWLLNYLSKAVSGLLVFDYVNKDTIVRKPNFRSLWPPVYNWIPHPATILNIKILGEISFDEKYRIDMDGDLWMKLLLNRTTLDLISVPIAKFSSGGISQNINNAATEAKSILWKHKWLAFKQWLDIPIRYLHAWKYFNKLSNKK